MRDGMEAKVGKAAQKEEHRGAECTVLNSDQSTNSTRATTQHNATQHNTEEQSTTQHDINSLHRT
jgi:hypothetical protein